MKDMKDRRDKSHKRDKRDIKTGAKPSGERAKRDKKEWSD